MQKLWLVGCAVLVPVLGSAQTPVSATPPATNAGSWFYSGPMLLDDVLQPIEWMGMSIQPYVSHTISRSSGRPGQSSTLGRTTMNRFTPGVDATLGPIWKLSYSPSWTWYTSKAYRDNVSQTAAISGLLEIGRGQMAVRQSFSQSNEALIETGRQTKQETWNTSLSYGGPISSQLGYIVEGTQDLRYTNLFTDSREHTASASLRYQVNPTLRVGAGGSIGYSDIDPGANTRFNRFQGTLSWNPGARLGISASFGNESRKILTNPAQTSDGPTYGLSATYVLTNSTTLIAGANKGIGTSFFASSVVKTESHYVGVSQRLLTRFTLSLRYREGTSKYEGSGGVANRDDDTSATSLDLAAPFSNKFSVSMFYQRTKNQSSDSIYALRSEEYGARVSYRF